MILKPVQRARRLIRKYGYESPDEIDLIDLLYAENLNLKYETTDDYQGKIVFNKYEGIITLSNNLENEYQKRYVIAHEMGHFFNEKFKIRNDKLRSLVSGQVGNEKLEIRQGGQVINDKLGGKESLESMAGGQERNEKSCLAADKLEITNDKLGAKVSDKKKAKNKNKNVAELYKGAMAVILSVNKRIEWMACNKNFAYGKLKKYEPIPLNTRTYDVDDKLMPNNYVKNQRIKRTGYKQFLKEQND